MGKTAENRFPSACIDVNAPVELSELNVIMLTPAGVFPLTRIAEGASDKVFYCFFPVINFEALFKIHMDFDLIPIKKI
jgi:hypothetical protein